jgi:hypothetical protein
MSENAIHPGNELDGFWQVERTGGLLPPLYAVRKQISGGQGWTRLGRLPLLPFDVFGLELRYRRPLQPLIDVLRPAGTDIYEGTTTLAGKQVGTFTMFRAAGNLLRDGFPPPRSRFNW